MEVVKLPVRKVKGGYKYGSSGKVYPKKEQAAQQGRAIQASKHAGKTDKKR